MHLKKKKKIQPYFYYIYRFNNALQLNYRPCKKKKRTSAQDNSKCMKIIFSSLIETSFLTLMYCDVKIITAFLATIWVLLRF